MNTDQEHGQSSEVKQLTPDEVMEHVQHLANLLAPAFLRAAGEVDVWSALKECALGRMQCFVGAVNGKINMAMITSFTDYPLLRVCDIVAYAGRARDFYWFRGTLEDWARDNGAVELRGYGTEATMKLAVARHGFKEVYRVYTKDLRKEQE